MKICAIVSEYNPFHLGHAYQIDCIRKAFDEDTAIIAVMSGSLVQRGELALMDKVERARCAVLGGVNLVLELPFPYSMASAEYFARAAVHIIHSLGVVDVLSFGSECGSLEALYTVQSRMRSSTFLKVREELMEKDKTLGYPKANELAYKKLYSDNDFTFSPNNILGLMYLDALEDFHSDITPYTIKRIGNQYNDTSLNGKIASASAIREGLRVGSLEALASCPPLVAERLGNAFQSGELLFSASRLDTLVLSHLLLNSSQSTPIHEGEDGLYNRLLKNARRSNTISDLITLSETKKYTRARIRRVLWNSIIGVTSSSVRTLPSYTQLLGADSTGLAILKMAKKRSHIKILTKPSRYDGADPLTASQIEMSQKTDILYALARVGHCASEAIAYTPFIKKDNLSKS